MVHGRGAAADKSLSAPWLGSIFGLLLCALVPVILVATTPAAVYESWVGAMLIVMLSGARFSWILASGVRRLFEMTAWLFVYVFLGVAPMVQLRMGVDPSTTPNIAHELDWDAIRIVLAGCLAIMLGSLMARHRLQTLTVKPPRIISRNRVAILGFGMISLGALYIGRLGIGALFNSRTELAAARSAAFPDSATSSLLTSAVTMGLLVALVAQLYLRRERKALGERAPAAMLVITFVMLFLCVNPVSSPRYVFGTVALGVLAALGIYRSVWRFRIVSISAILGLVFLFPLADLFRASLNATLNLGNPLDALLTGDFDGFAQINNSVLFVDTFGITWGNQALGVLLFWLPRSIWPGKAIDTGTLLADSRDYGFGNLSAPLWSELYINGGWVVLIAGMIGFGYLLRRWDESTERVLARTGVPTPLAAVVPFYLLIMLRGSLLQSMSYLTVILLCTWYVSRRPALTAESSAAPPGTLVDSPRPLAGAG